MFAILELRGEIARLHRGNTGSSSELRNLVLIFPSTSTQPLVEKKSFSLGL
jgi:hypothetical protein